jgi:uncharacterized membrane protein (Fun14 family)
VLGWLAKKLVKVLIIGVGLVCALLAYLEYQRWIHVDLDCGAKLDEYILAA